MRAVIGVDPGARGAIAIVNVDSGALIHMSDMPALAEAKGAKRRVSPALTYETFARWTHAYDVEAVIVEEVGGIPGQSAPAAFVFGAGYGVILGITATLQLPTILVRPQVWKAALGLTNKHKDASRALACRLWPAHAPTFSRRCDDGRAEAALLCRWHVERSGRQQTTVAPNNTQQEEQ